MQIEHIYIHVPFCSGKCLYCGFYSEIYNTDFVDKYFEDLETEIKNRTADIIPKTIYMGGGTPTLLSSAQLEILCQIIHRNINLEQLTEWTIEGNPGTFPADKIDVLKKHGINRVSIGAQSMDNNILASMARRHTAEDTIQTVRQLQSADIHNIGLDLIACLPNVATKTWKNTLDKIISLKPQHISVYALSIDPGSKLYEMQNVKPFSRTASPKQEQIALTVAENKLSVAGYHHYEVSNYSKRGNQCQHNTAVWNGADYIGFGPSASSRVGLQRWTNPSKMNLNAQTTAHETLSPEEDATERFMFSFRLYDGVNPEAFANNHGPSAMKLLPYWLKQLTALEEQKLVTNRDETWSLTKTGRNFADTVAEQMLP